MYEELLTYVKSDNDKVRSEAVSIVLGLTASPLEVEMENTLEQYFSALWRLACRPTQAGSKDALSALVNLADAYAPKLATAEWMGSICEEIEERRVVGPAEHERLLFMLLANITREELAVQELVRRDIFLWRILQHFALSGRPDATLAAREAGNYICNIFVNVSGFSDGRNWFGQFTPADWEIFGDQCRWPERRELALSVMKNIACDLTLLEEILKSENSGSTNIKTILVILARQVYPSAATLENLKQANTGEILSVEITADARGLVDDIGSRKLIIESLISLLRLNRIREIARDLQIYEVLRLWHTLESSSDIMEAIEGIVHLVHFTEQELAAQDRERQLELRELRQLQA